MVGSGMLDGLVSGLITIGVLIIVVIWGGWELIDWLFIDDAIKVTEPIVPELEIIVKDNVVDTLYVYRKP
jgi:hypothetical protein